MQRIGGTLVAITALMLILALSGGAHAQPKRDLIHNGGLSGGSGNSPDDWRTEAWINEPAAVDFKWTRPSAGGLGELEVNAKKADDARWMQSLSLGPGIYYFSAEIRTENVGQENSGANLSVMEDGIMSPEVKGTTGWTRVGFYLKVGAKGADVDLAVRVGGFGSLNTGRAFFRNVSGVKLDAIPNGAQPVYDLDQIRKQSEPVPEGSPLSLAAAFILLAAVAYAGWRMVAIEPPKVTRAEARREAKRANRR